jgi:ketosteroid isomerase-like protein
MAQSNLEAVRAVYERWGTGDFRASLEVMDPDVVFVMPPDLPDPGTYRGLEELAGYMKQFLEPWTHIAIEAEELFDGGDTVVAAIRQHGTGSATGIETEMRYFQVWSFSGEKVVRLENTRDRARAFDAAGLRE